VTPRRIIIATTLAIQAPSRLEQLPLRAVVVGLTSPVILALAVMSFWPETYGGPGEMIVSTARFGRTLLFELFLIATIGVWLWRQGWRPHRTATQAFESADLWRGLRLWLGTLLVCFVWLLFWRAAAPEWTDHAAHIRRIGELAPAIVVPLSLINAVFEEFLWLGLGVAALRRFGVGFAALVSVSLRTLVHVYQGPLALIAILPFGVVFTLYYVRARRLWPVVVAHACQDLVALGLIASGLMRGPPFD
jgi:membrane protease YdiL (CAAX protease family)